MIAGPLANAQGIHVFTAASRSGITAYAADFQDVVLGPEGYIHADPDTVLASVGAFAPETRFHVQLGVFQHRERIAMSALLKAGYRNVDATIHDPPFATFPYFQFGSKWLMRLSRGFDWYLRSFGIQRRTLEQLARIFVLSDRGAIALRRLAPRANVTVIPHLVKTTNIWPAGSPLPPALIYFGFIGPNKGLDYVIELHRMLGRTRPGTLLHVVGQPSGDAARRYLEDLRAGCGEDVIFHGYVPDDRLDDVFAQAAHVILPYTPYTHIMPASGSIVHALRRARIVWTNAVNSVPEMIDDGRNGIMLSMNAAQDAARLAELMADPQHARAISDAARQSAIAMADYPYRHHFSSGQNR